MASQDELLKLDKYYSGSRLLTFAADFSGLTIDQTNFLATQLLALALAPLFRTALHPSTTNPVTRHVFGLVLGLYFGYFCFGIQAIHLAGLPTICYILIRTQNPYIMQRLVLAVSLLYLSCVHLHRLIYDYGSYTLDITGPLMVIVQKVTTLAFSIHDGVTREEKDLTENQKYHIIKKYPSALEYFSYVFHHQTIMAGPVLFYNDYMDFINGTHLLTHKTTPSGNLDNNSNSKEIVLEPSPCIVVTKKVLGSLFCAFVFLKLIPIYPITQIKDDDFVQNTSLLGKLWFLNISTMLARFKYYHAWLLADAICNNSGLGFNGWDQDGNAKWDLISNIDVLKFEFGTNLHNCIDCWNKGTNRWLRMVVYDRVKKNGLILTYGLSALWHGFYPGYYLTFASAALFTISARMIRRTIRDYFTGNSKTKLGYDIVTAVVTRVVMGYLTFSFVILEFWPSVRLYLHMYLCLHILALLAIWVLPLVIPRAPKRKVNSATKISFHNDTNNKQTVPIIANGVHIQESHHD